MVALNFQPRFADLVEVRTKRQTIRRSDRVKVGDRLQLYTGQRTAACRKLVDDDPVCVAVTYCKLCPSGILLGDMRLGRGMFDAFARADGFADWDKFAPGPVPWLTLVDEGWWVECTGCSVRITADDIGMPVGWDHDDLDLAREYGPDLSRGIMAPIEPKPGAPFCNQTCHDAWHAERRRIKRASAAAHRIAVARLSRMFPGIEVEVEQPGGLRHHQYVTRDMSGYILIRDVRVHFMWPGARYGGWLRWTDEAWDRTRFTPSGRNIRKDLAGRERVWTIGVANGDAEAWATWLREIGRTPDGRPVSTEVAA
jgi:hypothetical protein